MARNDKNLNEIRKECSTNDWRNIFIKDETLIEYCEENLFDFQSDVNVQLLKSTTFSGKSVDAILYYLHKNLLKKGVLNEMYDINGAKRADNQSFIKLDYLIIL